MQDRREGRLTDSETLILPTHKDRAHDVADDKHGQKPNVQLSMAHRIRDTQSNQSDGSGNSSQDTQPTNHLLQNRPVLRQAARMSKPTLSNKRKIEENGRNDAAGDEEGFEARGTNV